jgi:hypothetical protein
MLLDDAVELGDVARPAVVGGDREDAEHAACCRDRRWRISARICDSSMSNRQIAAFIAFSRSVAPRSKFGSRPAARQRRTTSRIGAVAAAVGELHRADRPRPRDAVAVRLLALEAVLAQHLVERLRLLAHEVGVVGLLDHGERRDHFGGHDVRQQLPGKATDGAFAARSSSIALRAVASRNSRPPLTNSGSSVSSVNGR